MFLQLGKKLLAVFATQNFNILFTCAGPWPQGRTISIDSAPLQAAF